MPPLLISDCRKSNRLPHYDYSSRGYYFVTVCIENMWFKQFGEVNNKEMLVKILKCLNILQAGRRNVEEQQSRKLNRKNKLTTHPVFSWEFYFRNCCGQIPI